MLATAKAANFVAAASSTGFAKTMKESTASLKPVGRWLVDAMALATALRNAAFLPRQLPTALQPTLHSPGCNSCPPVTQYTALPCLCCAALERTICGWAHGG